MYDISTYICTNKQTKKHIMTYSTSKKNLINKAKKLMLSNPNVDLDTLANQFIQEHKQTELIQNLYDCLTEAYEQINK